MFYHSNVVLHILAAELRQFIAAVADSCNITIYDIVHCNVKKYVLAEVWTFVSE